MSLAMYAAPFDTDINQIRTNDLNNDNLQGGGGRKKMPNNKTVKKYPKENSDKVNSILQSIHNLPPSEQNDSYLSDFNPLPPPTSAGVENTRAREPQKTAQTKEPYYNENAIHESGGDMGSGYPDNPYMQMMMQQQIQGQKQQGQQQQSHFQNQYSQSQMGQQMGQQMGHSQGHSQGHSPSSEHEILLQKLNYMINLLEQNQDERTNNVTEEIVLYSFLGIFIIFIVDSFVRVGKYTR